MDLLRCDDNCLLSLVEKKNIMIAFGTLSSFQSRTLLLPSFKSCVVLFALLYVWGVNSTITKHSGSQFD